MTAAACKVTLREWERLTPEQNKALQGLSLELSCRSVAAQLTQYSLLGISELRQGIALEAFSHVGRLRIGDLDITVMPKIKQSSLLNLLRYAYGFRKLHLLSESAQQLEHAGFEDLLVTQLNAEASELLSRGLSRQYVARSEYLAAPRGRFDIQQIANDGGAVTACLPCTHYPRIEDTLLNRVLLAGLHLASEIASDIQLRRESRRLAAMLSTEVSAIRLNTSALERLPHSMNRLTVAYESAVSLICLLWESQGVSLTGSDSPVRVPGFLFDMNRFFQALLARFLKDNLSQFVVKEEHSLGGMMKYVAGFNPRNRRSPSPRPDFVILDGARGVAVLDAKYRDLWELPLGREMLYQLAMYAAVQQNKVATILYPTTEPKASESRIDVSDPVSRNKIAQVRLRPVILSNLESLVLAAPTAANIRERRELARWMTFGDASALINQKAL